MGLKHIKLPEAAIKFPGGDFAVRGLSLDDIAYLVGRHGAKMNDLFLEFQKGGAELELESLASFAVPLLKAAPEVAAELIACASGDPKDWHIAATLPVPVQLEALEKLVELTFNVEGGPKKVVETVIRMAQGVSGLLSEMSAQKA